MSRGLIRGTPASRRRLWEDRRLGESCSSSSLSSSSSNSSSNPSSWSQISLCCPPMRGSCNGQLACKCFSTEKIQQGFLRWLVEHIESAEQKRRVQTKDAFTVLSQPACRGPSQRCSIFSVEKHLQAKWTKNNVWPGNHSGRGRMDEIYTLGGWPYVVFFERVGGAYVALFCALVFVVVNFRSHY